MEAEDPLSQLRDIHLPDPVSFWPPAPGWWLLLVLVCIGLVFLCRHAIAAMAERRKLANVLSQLDQAKATYLEEAAFDHKKNQAGLDYLASVNNLLKRVAQVRLAYSGSAQKTGQEWLIFLDQYDDSKAFTQGAGKILGDGLYRRTFDGDVEALHDLARRWIENRYRTKAQSGYEELAA